jgi:hypothetical protein
VLEQPAYATDPLDGVNRDRGIAERKGIGRSRRSGLIPAFTTRPSWEDQRQQHLLKVTWIPAELNSETEASTPEGRLSSGLEEDGIPVKI